MKNWKRAAALALAAALTAALACGCGKGGEGLALSVWTGAAPASLDPIYASAPSDQTILAHLYEPLMTRRGTETVGGAARDVETEENADGTVTYTFEIQGEWSDGQPVTAADFVFAWQRLADPASGSPSRELLSVVAGYETVQETGDVTALQVAAEDEETFTVVVNGTYPWFLTEVCTAPAAAPLRQDLVRPEEPADETAEEAPPAGEDAADAAETPPEEAEPWWSGVEGLVTNGPYRVEEYRAGESLTLAASETYHEDIRGPRTLTFRFADTAEEGLALYEGGQVDFLASLPEAETAAAAAEGRETAVDLGVYALVLNCGRDTLIDPRVRQALSLAIDRAAAAEAAGADALPAEGLIPPGVPESGETDFRTAGGTLLDSDPSRREEQVQEAGRLLREAGYTDAKDLGTLEYLYVDSGSAAAVAQAVAESLESALGVAVEPRAVTEEELAAALAEGSFALAAVELRPLGNDAACYLTQWGSGQAGNLARYANSAYDMLLSVIAAAEDESARLGCLHDAEALLLAEAPVAPLYGTMTAWVLRDGLTGVFRDQRGWFSFSAVTTQTA